MPKATLVIRWEPAGAWKSWAAVYWQFAVYHNIPMTPQKNRRHLLDELPIIRARSANARYNPA